MKKVLVLLPLLLALQPISALIDISVDGGYLTTTLTNNVLSSSTRGDGQGYIAHGSARIHFVAAELLKMGIGPDFGFGSQSMTFTAGTASTSTQKAQRLGVDTHFEVQVVPIVKPYLRFRVGKEWLTNTSTGSSGGLSTELVTEYGALYYDMLLGATYPIFDYLSAYLQFGATGGTLGQATLKSYTVGGASQPYSLAGQTYYYSGFVVSAGAMVTF